MDADVLVEGKGNSALLRQRLQASLHSTTEGIGIAIGKDRRRTGLRGEFFQLHHGIAASDNQATADRLEIFGKRGERAAEELLPSGPRPIV